MGKVNERMRRIFCRYEANPPQLRDQSINDVREIILFITRVSRGVVYYTFVITAIGTDLLFSIHATFLNTSISGLIPSRLRVDVIHGWSLVMFTCLI